MSMKEITIRRSRDQFTATSLGTSTTLTTINGGNNLQTPDSVKAIIGVIPSIAPSAAITAGQSMSATMFMDSPSISLKPKQILVGPIIGGLGVSPVSSAPVLREVPFYTKINTPGVKLLTGQGQAHVANTAAPLGSMEIDYALDMIDPALLERFYQVPTVNTTGVTAIPNSTATTTGGTIQISTGKSSQLPDGTVYGGFLEMVQGLINFGTVTASKSFSGVFTFSSGGDILTSEPITVRMHPLVAALGTAIGLVGGMENIREDLHRPIKSSSLITQTFGADVAIGATDSNFIGGICYTQPP